VPEPGQLPLKVAADRRATPVLGMEFGFGCHLTEHLDRTEGGAQVAHESAIYVQSLVHPKARDRPPGVAVGIVGLFGIYDEAGFERKKEPELIAATMDAAKKRKIAISPVDLGQLWNGDMAPPSSG